MWAWGTDWGVCCMGLWGYSWGPEPASCGKWFMRHSSLLGRHCLSDITQWTLQAAAGWPDTTETHQYWNFDGGF